MIRHFKSICFLLFVFCSVSCQSEEGIFPEGKVSCTDGLKNGNETGVDCGGDCPPCVDNLVIPAGGYETPKSYDGYNLVWSDEFEAEELDRSKWSFHYGDGCPYLCGWGNRELQYYTDEPENVYVQDGHLIIRAINEDIKTYDYSSSRMHTDNKFEFKYGRIDIRAVMPSATGTWTALWLLNKSYSINQPGKYWPSGGEIDIMEYLGEEPERVMGTAHFGKDFPNNHRFISKFFTSDKHPFDKAFYVFSIIWEKDKIQWLVNDQVYHEITKETTKAEGQPYPFNDKFFLLMNLSVGGNLPKATPIISEFPTNMIIDYVRIFQR